MKNTLPRGVRSEAERQEILARIRADLASTTDEEDEAITRAAESDPDNLPNTFPRKKMGRPPAAVTKEVVTIRLDRDVVAHFRASGDGWQTRLNEALRKVAALE